MPSTKHTLHHPKSGLRTVLMLDALTCLAMGVALLALTVPVSAFTGLPTSLLLVAGLLLLPCALLMFVAGRSVPSLPGLVWLIVFGNLAWVAASIAVLLMVPNLQPLGQGFVVLQAIAVSLLAALEWRGLSAEPRTPDVVNT